VPWGEIKGSDSHELSLQKCDMPHTGDGIFIIPPCAVESKVKGTFGNNLKILKLAKTWRQGDGVPGDDI